MATKVAEKRKSFSLFHRWITRNDRDGSNVQEEETDDRDESSTDAILAEVLAAKDEEDEDQPANRLDQAHAKAPDQPDATWGGLMSYLFHDDEDHDITHKEKIDGLIAAARKFSTSSELSDTTTELDFDLVRSELTAVKGQLMAAFADINFDAINPISFMYLLEHEDAKKNPSWKRRKHRFLPGLEMETVYALHDALYLAHLAYADSVDDIQAGLENYQGDAYELIFATVEGMPREPAHFVALKRESANKPAGMFPWSESTLEVLMVVRGTKEIADAVSDALLECTEYKDGKAHNGILESGRCLMKKHLPLLNHLLEKSKRRKIKLTVIGHSLGAGSAAVVCVEANEQPNVEALCIGFGCPALFSKELSCSFKDCITTIVADADCVPRMSGATLANCLMDCVELKWQSTAMLDVQQILDLLAVKIPGIMTPEKKKSSTCLGRKILGEKCHSWPV